MSYKEIVKLVEDLKKLTPKLTAGEKGCVRKAVLLHKKLALNGCKYNAAELMRLITKAKQVIPKQDW